MHPRALVKLAARNAIYYWRYTVGAAFAIAAGFIALTLFRCYIAETNKLMELGFSRKFMYGDALIEPAGVGLLSKDDQDYVAQYLSASNDVVNLSARFLIGQGLIDGVDGGTIFWAKAFDVEAGAAIRGDDYRWDAVAGKPLQLMSGPDQVALGRGLAAVMGCTIGPTSDRLTYLGYPARERPYSCPSAAVRMKATTETGFVNIIDVHAGGIVDGNFRDLDNRLVVLPLATLQQLLDTQGVSYVAVVVRNQEGVDGFIERFRKDAIAAGRALKIQRWQTHAYGDLYRRTGEYMDVFSDFIAIIMIVLSGLSVSAAFLKLVAERSGEIGTMRAVGFHNAHLVQCFAAEAFMIAAVASVTGLFVTSIVTFGINAADIGYQGMGMTEPAIFRIAYDPEIYLTTALYLGFVSVVAACLAMRTKLKLSVSMNLIDVDV